MSATSSLGPGLGVLGSLLILDTVSPIVATTPIANIIDFSMPMKAETQDATNIGDLWRRRFPTLLDLGNPTLTILYIPKEATHENVSKGLRALMINQTLTYFKLEYPDGAIDLFSAYITSFEITAKVGKMFEAKITLSNSGAPQLA